MSALLTGTPLAGRIAVVSGASSGIGAATARRLAVLGARVAVLARRKNQLDALVESKLMADLIDQIDVLRPADVAETVAFLAAVPRHVDLTEITILPTAQAI
ncbi:SDR family NAD(P)-dependent oxidoreductase [Nonomuraea endophytica]|uniref:SDR family NAD(P)-dependent oxidoreductase n=1 Tax=Nonomuraea endophytica TaxID=714136 RepID=UPI0037C503AA